MTSGHDSTPSNSARSRRIFVAFVLCVALLALTLPLIVTDRPGHRGEYDQTKFHLPTIRTFSQQWPHFDFSDYLSATTPGYHVAIAAVDRFITHKVLILKLVGLLFALGLVATLGAAVARRAGAAEAIFLSLPFICSMYVISAAAWLSPDNAGWWGVLCILLIALRPRVDVWTYLLASVGFLALVLVRQSHIWVAVPLVLSAWLGSDSLPASEHRLKNSASRALAMLLCLLPAVAALAWFVMLWHGLLPPNQRKIVGGINLSAPALSLATTGAIGIFFFPLILHQLTSRTRAIRLAALGAAGGFVVSVLPPTTFNYSAGRYSGLWNLTPHAPAFHGRSALIVGLATLGGALIAIWLSLLPRRERCIWITAILAFGLAQIGSFKAFQRYDEPLILMAAAIGCAAMVRTAPRAAWIGPVLLCGLLLAVTYFSI